MLGNTTSTTACHEQLGQRSYAGLMPDLSDAVVATFLLEFDGGFFIRSPSQGEPPAVIFVETMCSVDGLGLQHVL